MCVCVCMCVYIPGAVVSSPVVQTVGLVVFYSPALPDSRRPFPGAAVLPSGLHLLLLLLLPPQPHGRSDGRLSSLTNTHQEVNVGVFVWIPEMFSYVSLYIRQV